MYPFKGGQYYHEKWKWLHTIFDEHPVIASNPGKRVFGKEAHVARCDEYLICLCSYIIYIIPISDRQETKINKKEEETTTTEIYIFVIFNLFKIHYNVDMSIKCIS